MTERPRRPRFLSAEEAAAWLGVSRSSLYAYVSRGRIHAESDPRDPRASRYLTADVERLRDRKQARSHPEVAARKALDWGTPVLESRLTLIERGRLFYRGQDALALARHAQFEDVVGLLWETNSRVESLDASSSGRRGRVLAKLRGLSVMERLQAVLSFAAADDRAAFDLTLEAVIACGWRILDLLTAAATLGVGRGSESISARLANGWNLRTRSARRLLDLALILCADHELNVSAFAVRVVASAASSPYHAVAAGLCALGGPRHGGGTEQVEAFLDESGSSDGVHRAMAARVRQRTAIPGFGHPLYPDGDPRAKALFVAIETTWPKSAATGLLRASREGGRALLGEEPNLDFGLVMLRRALGLPRGSALVLFALGRTAGWMAHAMEQYGLDQLIRPRAAYIGPLPPQAAERRSLK